MVKDEFKGLVKEYNDESCSWCKSESNCFYKRKAMEATREAIKEITICTSAYCTAKVSCDYYRRDSEKYNLYNVKEG
ncbi:hypothetical protein [Clostridium beijerinckii]|uniref:Uncharacterized protein n=1 Tax=Clostridium beijerinckii TaxID=1520 RepID=A0A1S8RS67_CLOBE|nr:hypothetical protein [Clostridium beijerinckii]NRT34825.1 hypothetical protein [Clostridium beijerinckii]NRT45746.1 hypothetical protein [Clostridium beijerinckii]NRT87829.1 hypothetical protein [Clostridium beijerinckii]NRY63336.1 hypothetical protein [Clostridium beijerinckii]NRZ20253.1 hypothetical protein [Clostridium beijerinckii]